MSSQPTHLTDVLSLDIEILGISVRLYNQLKREGVNTLGNLLKLSEVDLLTMGPARSRLTGREVEEAKRKLQIVNAELGTDFGLAPNPLPADHLVDYVDSIPER
jgi:DNA-directed RNA polymerase alpha subunit